MNLINILTIIFEAVSLFNNVFACNVETPHCLSYYVCPKYTQMSCGGEGIEGYTTYQLSLVVQDNKNVENVFALYGDEGKEMFIPSSYQLDGPFDTDLGGISPSIISIFPDALYDSWITIGITDGDRNNKLSTIGIDFSSWSDSSPIITTNGAVFLMDPTELVSEKEYIIAQLTLSDSNNHHAKFNVNGKKITGHGAWSQDNVRFDFTRTQNNIPRDCAIWYDGCHICTANNGNLGSCTNEQCMVYGTPECRLHLSSH